MALKTELKFVSNLKRNFVVYELVEYIFFVSNMKNFEQNKEHRNIGTLQMVGNEVPEVNKRAKSNSKKRFF